MTSLFLVGTLVAALTACTEPRVSQRDIVPTPSLEARLELSDSMPQAGTELRVRVQIAGTAAEAASHIASFTIRVAYDTSGLRFVADVPLDDGATRVNNPQPGLIRSAGVDATGFASGTLTSYRFLVRSPAAVRRMRLTVDELHAVSRANATASVRVPVEPIFVRIP